MKHFSVCRALATALFALLCPAAAPILRAADSPVTESPRASICLNGEWETALIHDDAAIAGDSPAMARVPSAPSLDPKVIGQWCRLFFSVPKEWMATDRRFLIEFEKVGHYAEVFCNGRKIGEHFGQYSPFECDATAAIRFGRRNDLTVFVHNASGKYVRPGADITEEMVANGYRPAANQQSERNWVGIAGDVTLSWRPTHGITDVFVDTSVRRKTITAFISVPSSEAGATLRATVLDEGKPVLELPSAGIGAGANASLSSGWNDPVLWGSAPYGEPKLYTLRTELVSADGRTVDRVFTRFGFREVWVSGQDVLLNGRKLWLAGTYFSKHSAIRDVNDRRPILTMINVMRGAGLNTVHGHWDDLGRTWLDVCDETGMFVVAGFFCDGRPQIQSRADPGWAEWMNATCAEWVRARRNHPSIVLWRPTDVPPPQLNRFISLDDFHAGIAAEVRKNDPAKRPIADGSDVAAWGQPPEDRTTGEFNNFGPLQTNHDSGKPFLCKEIYGGFNQPEKYSAFVEEYYRRSFALGSTGMLVQQLPLVRNPGSGPFAISWLSLSGIGNRNTSFAGSRGELPNWCDPHSALPSPSPFAELFHKLLQKYMNAELEPAHVSAADVLVDGGLSPKSLVFMAPENAAAAEPRGLLTAPDGSAWFAAVPAGDWRFIENEKSVVAHVAPGQVSKSAPGYGNVQRITLPQ